MKKPARLPAPFAPAAPLTSHPSPLTLSAARLRANRRNAKKSTGPRTPQGKARSSRNALKNGLIARAGVLFDDLQPEDRALFQEVLDDLREAYHPVGSNQELLLRRAALCHVRLRRAMRLETIWAAEQRRKLRESAVRDAEQKLAELNRRIVHSKRAQDHATADQFHAERATVESGLQHRLEDADLSGALPAPDRLDALIRYEGAVHREAHRVARELECWLGMRRHASPFAPV